MMNLTEPPLLIGKSMEEIEAYADIPFVCEFPCHTQETERQVKLTTESVSRITTPKRQISEALCKLKGRSLFKGKRVCKKGLDLDVLKE